MGVWRIGLFDRINRIKRLVGLEAWMLGSGAACVARRERNKEFRQD
jgi:hypothetical protein